MKNNNIAGVWFAVFLLGYSFLPLFEEYGTLLENLINSVQQFTTIMVMVLLFEKWVYLANKMKNMSNLVAMSHVFITIASPLHMAFEYSEQTMPNSYLFVSFLEISIAIVIAKILIKE